MIERVDHLLRLGGVVSSIQCCPSLTVMGEALWLRDNNMGRNSLRKKII